MRRRAILLASAASAAAIVGGWQLGEVATSGLTAPGAPTVTNASAGSGSGPAGSGSSTAQDEGAGSVDFDALTPNDATSGAGGGSGSGSGSTDSGSGSTGTGAAPADGTYAGSTISTRFGDVQVQVTIAGGAISDVTALQLTDHDGRSVQISNRAEPVLRSEVLQAQSASVSLVSGATYTSAGYLQSLQSALDAAGFRG